MHASSLLPLLLGVAPTSVPHVPWQAQTMGEALLAAAAFGLVGLVLVLLGFKAFDGVTPKIDVQKELTENKNNAVAIVAAAVIIGVAIVVSKAIAG